MNFTPLLLILNNSTLSCHWITCHDLTAFSIHCQICNRHVATPQPKYWWIWQLCSLAWCTALLLRKTIHQCANKSSRKWQTLSNKDKELGSTQHSTTKIYSNTKTAWNTSIILNYQFFCFNPIAIVPSEQTHTTKGKRTAGKRVDGRCFVYRFPNVRLCTGVRMSVCERRETAKVCSESGHFSTNLTAKQRSAKKVLGGGGGGSGVGQRCWLCLSKTLFDNGWLN